MVLTKKDYLEKQYKQLIQEVKKIIDVNISPSLDSMDMTDILMFFTMTFNGVDDYEENIKSLLQLYSLEISDENFNSLMPIITKYINELKAFIKKN